MKKVYICLLAGLLSFTSCNDWLDVDPKTSIAADKQFSSEYGFKDALTGIYLKLTSTNLYGRNLTFGYLDELARLYQDQNVQTESEWRYIYNYKNEYKSTVNGIFVDMYNTIANINQLLTMLEEKRDVLKTPRYYETMKGEALGLRAFLHFDLLRLYGPIFKENPIGQSIPYRKVFNDQTTPILPANEVVELILNDLLDAQEALKDSDPLDFFTDRSPEGGLEKKDMFLLDRQFRMNLYAVKAMLARVYCYKGDAESRRLALQYANEVINAPYFSLYNRQSNTDYNSIRYAEQVFGISVVDLDDLLERNNMSMGSASSIEQNLHSRYVVNEELFNKMYEMEAGGTNDWRTLNVMFGVTDSRFFYCLKYNQDRFSSNADGKDAMPLIRLPEMYYIIAECTDDAGASVEVLNDIRQSRGWSYDDKLSKEGYDDLYKEEGAEDKTLTKRVNLIMKEYRKEYYAEGQLFFYLKAHNFKSFIGNLFPDGMLLEHYQWPLPDNEIIFGNNSK